jgi:hypothetical protein
VKIRFGPFILDLDTRQLTRGKREIHLASKAYELLATLVLDRPKVLSKAVLQQRLWPETFVAEANLSNLVAEIREALGDRAHAPQRDRIAPRAGSSGAGGTFLCQKENTWWDAIPTSRFGLTRRRSPAVTLGSW